MHPAFSDINRQGLTAFGESVIITDPDGNETVTNVMFKNELAATGHYDDVMQEITAICLPSTIKLERGYRVTYNSQEWTVDRRIKDNGILAYWNLHEYIS